MAGFVDQCYICASIIFEGGELLADQSEAPYTRDHARHARGARLRGSVQDAARADAESGAALRFED